jgi:predicted nucleic acid-binding protein
MFILDTNVISELRKAGSGRADTGVVAWAESVEPIDLFLSAVTILELEFGVLRIEQRDQVQGTMLREWLDQRVLPEFADRVLPVDTHVARRCAALHIPDPRSDRDAMIAATALVHGMTIVTRNVDEFKPTGVKLLNPWNSPVLWRTRETNSIDRGTGTTTLIPCRINTL